MLPAPTDLNAQLKELKSASAQEIAERTRYLAGFELDLNQLIRFDKLIAKLGAVVEESSLSPVRLAVLASGTTDYIAPAIRSTGHRFGFHISTYVTGYNQGSREAIDSSSGVYSFEPEFALIGESPQSLGLTQSTCDVRQAEQSVAHAINSVALTIKSLRANGVQNIIVQTLPIPLESMCGNFDRRFSGSIASQVSEFNRRLVELCEETSAVLFDVEALASSVGRELWHDAAEWYRSKVPFALMFTPLYADSLVRLIAALRGKSRKCLVLDLDNTCWGGVIGDDGLEGIKIGEGSGQGEAFLAVQKYALALKSRGIVLAVCSKNEEAAAKMPFESHPEMALKLSDFAVFVANWTDKASNLATIAKRLNIGVDALVFLDDNPAERERVRQLLPSVAVPEVPEDSSLYPLILTQAGYFETVNLTADDYARAEQYRANAIRSEAVEAFGDYEEYLNSLEMKCDIRSFDGIGRARIAQLVNKSNQFNLTTRRYTEPDIAQFQDDSSVFDLQVRLADRFGDNGMISVIIFNKHPDEWVCDLWLMSCRVIGRRVEEAVLAVVADAARAEGVNRLIGEYIPSAKNAMVAEHFQKLGFEQIEELDDGTTRWALDLTAYEAPDLPMEFTGLVETVRKGTV
ncbi:HAD-IIIC family phosphatase [Blastopirellula marina]|uniref:HAD-IIIC family phosphatase n=1 Tax=Blastopirellula marina TaxID=124 RepID=UPI0013047FC7|nr:HAD-IIIC family phosphatase [Blastopirellula marina]